MNFGTWSRGLAVTGTYHKHALVWGVPRSTDDTADEMLTKMRYIEPLNK